jgi:hypothetical protein
LTEILSATRRVVARRFGYVLAVAIAIAAPGEVLVQINSASPGASIFGAVLTLVASVTLVLVMVSDLQSRPLLLASSVSPVVNATIRTIGAFLVLLALLIIPLFVAMGVIVLVLGHGGPATLPEGVALLGLLMIVEVFLAPLSLVVPISLNEAGGPRWALQRAWAISAPRRGQVRLVLGGWEVLTSGFLFVLRGFGQATGPSVATVVVAVVGDVVAAALLAVLYELLTRESPETKSPTSPTPNRVGARRHISA